MFDWLPFALFALACPLGMGLMTLLMWRSMRGGHKDSGHEATMNALPPRERLNRLEAEKRDLERQIAAEREAGRGVQSKQESLDSASSKLKER